MERFLRAQQIIASIIENNGKKWPSTPKCAQDFDFPFKVNNPEEHIYVWAKVENDYTYFKYICRSWKEDRKELPHIMIQFDETLFMVQVRGDEKTIEYKSLNSSEPGYKLFQEAIDRYAIERFALEQIKVETSCD